MRAPSCQGTKNPELPGSKVPKPKLLAEDEREGAVETPAILRVGATCAQPPLATIVPLDAEHARAAIGHGDRLHRDPVPRPALLIPIGETQMRSDFRRAEIKAALLRVSEKFRGRWLVREPEIADLDPNEPDFCRLGERQEHGLLHDVRRPVGDVEVALLQLLAKLFLGLPAYRERPPDGPPRGHRRPTAVAEQTLDEIRVVLDGLEHGGDAHDTPPVVPDQFENAGCEVEQSRFLVGCRGHESFSFHPVIAGDFDSPIIPPHAEPRARQLLVTASQVDYVLKELKSYV